MLLYMEGRKGDIIKKKAIIDDIEGWYIKMTDIRLFVKALKISLIYGGKNEPLKVDRVFSFIFP